MQLNFMQLNLTSEIQLDDDTVATQNYQQVTKPKAVFLTGGSGFLGAFVIADLLSLTDADIYCLVRAKNNDAAKQRILDNLQHYGLSVHGKETRIFALAGDLEKPLFALEQRTYNELSVHIEMIYHLAAQTSFIPKFKSLKPSNIFGLQQVLRLACLHHTKAVHYVSTYGVFNTDAYKSASKVFESELIGNNVGLKRGYEQTKWVAEKICILAKQRGIPVSIYRAGIISGDTRTGIQNISDTFSLIIAAVLCIGAAIPIKLLLHLTPVDFCSQALVRLSLKPETQNQIFHLIQENPISWLQLLTWLDNEGYPLERVGLLEWQQKLKSVCSKYPVFLPILYLLSLDKIRNFGEDANIFSLQFDASNVNKYLEPVYHCPKINHSLLETYMTYMTSSERNYSVIPRSY